MKDLNALQNKAVEMLKALDCQIGSFTMCASGRMTRNWGKCHRICTGHYPTTYRYEITIASILLRDDVDDKATLDTILHEILHTVKGCFDHGALWKSWAERVNVRYNMNIKRVTNAIEKGEVVMNARERVSNYRAYCPNCGAAWMRNKSCKLILQPERFSCPHCHTPLKSESLNPKYEIWRAR